MQYLQQLLIKSPLTQWRILDIIMREAMFLKMEVDSQEKHVFPTFTYSFLKIVYNDNITASKI